MEVFEIYTIGAGFYLEKVFNALKMILNGNFATVMKTASIGAIVVLAIRAGINNDFKAAVKWFLGVTILVALFLNTKATVMIFDTLPDSYGQTAAPRRVEDIPWGLALIGSITSQVGNSITEKFDTSLSGVFNNPDYQKTGILFGSKLVEDVSKLRVSDPRIKQFMLQFYKKCIVPDLNMGLRRVNGYTVKDLTSSDSILEFLSEHSSKARLINRPAGMGIPGYGGATTNSYISCNDAAKHIEKSMEYEANRRIPILSKSFLKYFQPDKQEADSSEIFKSVLSGSYGIFIKNASKDAKDILLQNMAINSLGDTIDSQTYGKVATEAVTKSAYYSVSQMAQKFVPILRAVLECLFYGVFPLVLILMVTPIGLEVLKNYAFGFVYLQLWQPMYAILFCIAAAWGEHYASAITGGITFGSHSQIARINEEISSVAGYMLTLVPVLSLFITKGMVASMGNLASSITYIPQSAAVQNAEGAVKGNYQLGTTSIDTHSSNISNSNKHDDNYAWMSGMKSFSMSSGASQMMFGDSRMGINSSGAVSNTAGLMEIDWNKAYGSRLDQNINDNISRGEHYASRSIESATTGYSKLLGYDQSFAKGSSTYEDWKQGLSSEQRSSIDEARSYVEKYAESHNMSQQDALKLAVAGNIGFGGKMLGFSLSEDRSTGATKQDNYNQSLDSTHDKRFADNLSKIENIATSSSHQDGASINNSIIESAKGDFSNAKSASLEASRSFDIVHSLQQSKSAFEHDSTNITQKLTNMATERGIREYGASGFEQMIRNRPNETREFVNKFADEMIGKDISGIKAEFTNQKSQLNNTGIKEINDNHQQNQKRISDESSSNISKVNKAAPQNFKNSVVSKVNTDIKESTAKNLPKKNGELQQLKEELKSDSAKLEKKVIAKNNQSASGVLVDAWFKPKDKK